MDINLRLLYLYLFSLVGLVILVIGSIRIIDLGIKSIFFQDADSYYQAYPSVDPEAEGVDKPTSEELAINEKIQLRRNRQRELSGSLSMVIVGLPLYLYHWRKINSDFTVSDS